jgi:Family of unknown function (DUF6493)
VTADRLRELIARADRPGIEKLLAPLDEAARASLAPLAASAFAEARQRNWDLMYSGPPDRQQMDEAKRWSDRRTAAALAWLGTGDFADFPPPREPGHPQWYETFEFYGAIDAAEAYRVLVRRRPAWLSRLAAELVVGWRWNLVWRLVVDGAVPRPAGEAYLRGMAAHAAWGPESDLGEMVRRDPDLLAADLPALLDLPGGLSAIVVRDTRNPRGAPTWLPVLNAHFPPGHPVRDRLLDELFHLLSGDPDKGDAARLHKFLDGLAPTPDELTRRRRMVFALAASRVPGVVSYAVRILARLGRVRRIAPGELLDAVEPALLAPAKSTAAGALGIVTAALRREPSLAGRAAQAFLVAATHPHAEVQLAAIDAALPLTAAHPDLVERLRELLPDLAGSAAQRMRDALPDSEVGPPAFSNLDELIRRAEKVPPDAARAAGLDRALDAVRRRVEPSAAPVREAAGGPGFRPVSTVDELVEVLLRVADGAGDVVDLERALDGIARTGPHRTGDFGRRVGPLVRRINERRFADEAGSMMCWLAAWWLKLTPPEVPDQSLDTPFAWLFGRVREVASGVTEAETRPLLALPTDPRGWLDPAVLVSRARAAGGAIRRPVDTAVALARLAPSGRVEAVRDAADLPGDLGRAVRAALSGEEAHGLPDVVVGVLAWQRSGPHHGPPYLFGQPEQALRTPRDLRDEVRRRGYDQQYVADLRSAYEYERTHGSAPWWSATLWPGDHEWLWRHHLTAGPTLRLLLDPDEPVTPDALLATVRQAASEKPEERGLAVDVLVQAIGDGRLTGAALGRAVRRRYDTEPARLVGLLQETASASALHRAVVRAGIIAALPEWLGDQPVGQHTYRPLALLDELCATDGTPVTGPAARAVLTRLATGGSKTAAVARRLRDRDPAGDTWPAEALAGALAARIDRAER